MLCLKHIISCVPFSEETANFFPSARAGGRRGENPCLAGGGGGSLTQGTQWTADAAGSPQSGTPAPPPSACPLAASAHSPRQSPPAPGTRLTLEAPGKFAQLSFLPLLPSLAGLAYLLEQAGRPQDECKPPGMLGERTLVPCTLPVSSQPACRSPLEHHFHTLHDSLVQLCSTGSLMGHQT